MGAIKMGYYTVYFDDDVCINDANYLAEHLPHGSGINGDWTFTLQGKYIHAHNVYFAMDENGAYCHVWPFMVTIENRRVKDVVLSDDDSCECSYGLEDYLFDVCYWSLVEQAEIEEQIHENSNRYFGCLCSYLVLFSSNAGYGVTVR